MNPAYAVIARLPSHTEYWYSDTVPQAGTVFLHQGEQYEVVSCEEDGEFRFVVRLEPLPPADPSPTEPIPDFLQGNATAGRDLLDDLAARLEELDRVAWNLPAAPVTIHGSADLERDRRLGLDEPDAIA